MNDGSAQIQKRIEGYAEKVGMQIAERVGSALRDYIRYEYAVSNMELASVWSKRGYRFQAMPERFVEDVEISPVVQDGNLYKLEVVIEGKSFANASAAEIEYFKTYPLANALKKISMNYGGWF